MAGSYCTREIQGQPTINALQGGTSPQPTGSCICGWAIFLLTFPAKAPPTPPLKSKSKESKSSNVPVVDAKGLAQQVEGAGGIVLPRKGISLRAGREMLH